MSVQLYGSRDLKWAAIFNRAFLFCWSECVRGLLLGTALKILNNLKRQQTYCTWINFLLDWTFYVTLIGLLLMKHKLINFDWIVNNLIVCKLLTHYLNLIKESVQKQLFTEQMFFEIGVLENFSIFNIKHLCWSLFLIKWQACNFPVNIAIFWEQLFIIKHLRWLLKIKISENSRGDISGGGVIGLSIRRNNIVC